MIFDNAVFIKPDILFERQYFPKNNAPLFRKTFHLDSFGEARFYVCGLGIGYYYINGHKVSQDLFTAPISNYCKTLWYNVYDVSHLLKPGENTIAVICGNGWYNETIRTSWNFDRAPWRDVPKFIARLEVDGATALVTDSSWKCLPESAVVFNQIRSGEYFDARLYDPCWIMPDYDDTFWTDAARDCNPPTGTFRECMCESIRETEVYSPVSVQQVGDKKFVYDMGHNISGYIRLTASGKSGQELTIRYAEVVAEDGNIEYYGMYEYCTQKGTHRFQTDKFICSGEQITWSPMFTYHGFRYIEIEGISDPSEIDVKSVFVHQDIKRRSSFECSDEFLNRMFEAGVVSSYSNMFYAMTDCPTREKLGWTNDAQSSTEQLLINFETEKLFEKWHRDIKDAMLADGALPGIIPSSGWGYHWGNGPVSDGILFEIPYRVYLHTGKPDLLISSLDWFDRYFRYLDDAKDSQGFVSFGLDDWAAPGHIHIVEPELINAVLEYNFYNIAAIGAEVAGDERVSLYNKRAANLESLIKSKYIAPDGRCTIDEQCSVSMLIYYGIYDKLEPLAAQLLGTLEKHDFHLCCGMVGMRRILHALTKCGYSSEAYRLLTAEGYPGYKYWFDQGAVSLWEKWDTNINSDSKNHHMYSDFMSWMVKALAGIRLNEDKCGELEFVLEPDFIKDIDFVRFDYATVCGNIHVEWHRRGDVIELGVTMDDGVKLVYNGEQILQKENKFIIQGE